VKRPPNIVFLFSDDHALQAISAYGGPLARLAPTPNIDRLAREGALFQNSFCANSICGPSRACILTGKHSHSNGFTDNDTSTFDGSQVTFPKLLQKAGYQTALFGKWHLVSDPTGFDSWEVLPGQGNYYNPDFLTPAGRVRYSGHVTDITTRLTLRWLQQTRDPNRPFLLMCQHKAPHRNWMPAPEHLRLFDGVTFPEPPTLQDTYGNRASALSRAEMSIERHLTWLSDLKLTATPDGTTEPITGELARMTPEQRAAWEAVYSPIDRAFRAAYPRLTPREVLAWKYQRYLTDYLRCVRGVDDSVERVLAALDTAGLAENTIVVYSSDQGFYLGEHGWYDKRWMFEESLKMPLAIRWPGVVRPGLRPDALVQNIDYAPTFLEAAGIRPPKEIQGESLLPVLRGGRLAREAIYYRYTGEKTHNVAAHDGVRTHRHKLMYFPQTDEWNLFDLKTDPQELRSVHADPAYTRTRVALTAMYHRLRKRYQVPAS
jgi:arylsulfatase A-like enzyme